MPCLLCFPGWSSLSPPPPPRPVRTLSLDDGTEKLRAWGQSEPEKLTPRWEHGPQVLLAPSSSWSRGPKRHPPRPAEPRPPPQPPKLKGRGARDPRKGSLRYTSVFLLENLNPRPVPQCSLQEPNEPLLKDPESKPAPPARPARFQVTRMSPPLTKSSAQWPEEQGRCK